MAAHDTDEETELHALRKELTQIQEIKYAVQMQLDVLMTEQQALRSKLQLEQRRQDDQAQKKQQDIERKIQESQKKQQHKEEEESKKQLTTSTHYEEADIQDLEEYLNMH